jgi:hypothetical protein
MYTEDTEEDHITVSAKLFGVEFRQTTLLLDNMYCLVAKICQLVGASVLLWGVYLLVFSVLPQHVHQAIHALVVIFAAFGSVMGIKGFTGPLSYI